ncbi:zinc knuckle, partial [Ostertagia ostertagi]
MSGAHDEPMGEENMAPHEVSSLHDCLSKESEEREWSGVAKILSEGHRRIMIIVGESKASKQAKADIESEWGRMVEAVRNYCKQQAHNPSAGAALTSSIKKTMEERGIESEVDWEEYIATMERDGEIVSKLCDLLKVNPLQINDCVGSLLEHGGENKCAGVHDELDAFGCDNVRQYSESLQANPCSIGPRYAESWSRQSRASNSTTPMRENAGADVNSHLINYLRAMTCADPGVFKGGRNENFKEFIRKFKRRYENIISCEATLIDILSDDHLTGRAKNIFMSLPRIVRERGFEAVVNEMCKLLACDSTASRMRALNDLKHLRLRPNQDVAEFCVVLEKLGRQANPEGTLEDHSMEYAQILLDNLSGWPEHFQLVGALHKVEPRKAYEEIKSLALSIEQSKLILATHRKDTVPTWRVRSAQYHEGREGRAAHSMASTEPGREERNKDREPRSRGPVGESRKAVGSPQELRQDSSSRVPSENRKCYSCSRYGHVARECPLRTTRVNQIEPKNSAPTQKQETLSSIIKQARCMGVAVKESPTETGDLIGQRITVPLEVKGERCEALVDTGSMISIVPVGLLARIQDKGFDVDSWTMIPKSELRPVFDASNNRMNFLAAVYIKVTVAGGEAQEVAFHVSPQKGSEVILGTNALKRLGIEVSMGKRKASTREEESVNKVLVVGRRYIPPRDKALVEVFCEGEESCTSEKVLWPSRQGMAAGVYTIREKKTTVPIHNNSNEPMLLKEGDQVGYWDTDKWHGSCENPLMPVEEEDKLTGPERIRELEALISVNMEGGQMDRDVQKLVKDYADAFSISDQELSQTDLAYMTIDTGSTTPIKMKTRPVPLGVRAKLKELLADLVTRKVIEPSKSDWAFPIVLVEKKDGSIRFTESPTYTARCVSTQTTPPEEGVEMNAKLP